MFTTLALPPGLGGRGVAVCFEEDNDGDDGAFILRRAGPRSTSRSPQSRNECFADHRGTTNNPMADRFHGRDRYMGACLGVTILLSIEASRLRFGCCPL